MWNIILRGSLSNVHILVQKFAYFELKRTLGRRNLRFLKKKSAQSRWAFVLVCLYSRVYVGNGWLLVTSRCTNEGFSSFCLNPLLRGKEVKIWFFYISSISCNTSKWATFISLNHFWARFLILVEIYYLEGGGAENSVGHFQLASCFLKVSIFKFSTLNGHYMLLLERGTQKDF